MAEAIFSLVPTPSALETSTGSFQRLRSRAKERAERANAAEHAAGESARGQAANALLGLVGARDIDACIGVAHVTAVAFRRKCVRKSFTTVRCQQTCSSGFDRMPHVLSRTHRNFS